MECMLLKAEYEANFSYLNPSLDTLINAAKGIVNFALVTSPLIRLLIQVSFSFPPVRIGSELENCRKLHEVLYLILIAGNFLNSVSSHHLY